MTGAVCSTTGAGLYLYPLPIWRPPPSQTRKTAKLIRGAIEPKTLDIACFSPLQSPYFIGFSGAKVDL